MKALVTGSAGFVGRHLARELDRRGWDVLGCDTQRSTGLRAWQCDIVDLLAREDERFDLVVHAAAVEPHRAAIDGNPMHLAANLRLDVAMFGWAVRTEQRRLLYLSSSAAYPVHMQTSPDTGWGPLLETYIDPAYTREPDAGYGWLKLTGERLAADAAAAGLAVHVVRPFSGYGEDQDERWPFGAFAARARRREDPFVIWGDGTQVRDWIHIDDLAAGALAVVEADCREPVNLCTGAGTSMAELVTLFCQRAGYTPHVELRTDRPPGVAYRVGDPARMNRYHTAKVDITEGVARALA